MVNSNLLRNIRMEKGISVAAVCEALGKTRDSYYKKQRGDMAFTVEDIMIIGKLLNLSADEVNVIFFNSEFS